MEAKMYKWSAWVAETRPDVLHSKCKTLLTQSGFCVLDECHAMFDPFGYTCVILLSESHLAIHTFPERGKSYIELTSCVSGQFNKFISAVDFDIVEADGGGDYIA